MKAALDGARRSLAGDHGAHRCCVDHRSLDDAIARARAYEATGVDALFFTGMKTRAELEAIAAATTLPIVLGGCPEEMIDPDLSRRPAGADRVAGSRAVRRRDAGRLRDAEGAA